MGVSRNDFSLDGMLVAAEELGVEWPFEFVSVGKKKVLAIASEGWKYHEAIALLRRKTSERGCVNVLSLISELKLDESKLPGLMRVLDGVSEVEWLDDSHQWLYSSQPARNRLLNVCSKVLGVVSRVHLSELRRAVSRSRRMAMCPPQRVLGAFVVRSGLGSVDNSMVLVDPGSETKPAENSAEAVMLRVLDEYGPVMDGDDFAETCIAAGVNATTFYIYRSGSPVIGPLGKNVYCKVGTIIPPGTVEDIVARRRVVKRASDYGWTSAGRLWCGTELSRMVITFGSIALPTFATDFVQGEWNVMLPDGTECGKVKCRDTFIWSFSRAFGVLGAEPSDLAVLEFDLKSRQLMVTVGGPDLFDAIQDPNYEILEDGPEEV